MMTSALKRDMAVRRKKVLIVDDSPTICRFLEATFSEDPGLEVVGYALDPYEADRKIKSLRPDVLTLDIEMPKMDGVTYLRRLMRTNPMPVVMFSSLTEVGATATMDSLQYGAVDFMPKRSARSSESMDEYVKELVRKVKAAASAHLQKPAAVTGEIKLPDPGRLIDKLSRGTRATASIPRLIAIGASTGGPEALRHFLSALELTDCSFAIVQHMPANFMKSFAQRLNAESAYTVSVAEDGEKLMPGHGYVAPGDRHLELQRSAGGYIWKVVDQDKVRGHRPSVDVMFDSFVDQAPRHSIGVLLTGMGDDGANGLRKLRDAGGVTLIQDEETSVVWGMPGKAAAIDAQDEMLELRQLAPTINTMLKHI